MDILVRFGGKEKVRLATKTHALDDVWCWEVGFWVTQRYWQLKMKNLYTGVTLRELLLSAKL